MNNMICDDCQARYKCFTCNRQECHVTIDARRWFEKTNGNTYHSVSVYVNNEQIGRIPFTYGYGEQYIQSAFDILSEFGMFPYEKTKELVTVNVGMGAREYQTPKEYLNKTDAWHKFRKDMMDNRQKYHVTCVDVPRKKDL